MQECRSSQRIHGFFCYERVLRLFTTYGSCFGCIKGFVMLKRVKMSLEQTACEGETGVDNEVLGHDIHPFISQI